MKKTLFSLSIAIILSLLFASDTLAQDFAQNGLEIPKVQENSNHQEGWLSMPKVVTSFTIEEREYQIAVNKALADEYVLTFCPNIDNARLTQGWQLIDFEEITPGTWKWVEFRFKELEGSISTIKLRRPNWWLVQNHAGAIGNHCILEIPELLLAGEAEVVDIWPSLIDTRFEIFKASGENRYRPITGWFERTAPEVWDFVFSSGDTIGATPAHLFYSEDRQGFVAVGELAISEKVRVSHDGAASLIAKHLRLNGAEKVCNLEVWREHNFHVGKSGQLVHNNCIDWLKIHNYAPPENSNTALGHIFSGHAFGSSALNKSKFAQAISGNQNDLKKFLEDFQARGKIVHQDLEVKGNGTQRPRYWYDVSEMMNKGDYIGTTHVGVTDKGVPTNIIRLVLDDPTSFSPYTCFPVEAAGK